MRIKCYFFIVLIVSAHACSQSSFQSKWTKQKAPAVFVARFETCKGNFDVEIHRAWSPFAADRFYQTVVHHFYDGSLFYRVVPGFVVQFGNTDTTITRKWERIKVPDEPVLQSNLKGTFSFARSGADSRGGDPFINLADNAWLDTLNYSGIKGFPVFGKVVKGMEVVEAMYGGYADETMKVYDSLSANRVAYTRLFPKLDSIRRAYILPKK